MNFIGGKRVIIGPDGGATAIQITKFGSSSTTPRVDAFGAGWPFTIQGCGSCTKPSQPASATKREGGAKLRKIALFSVLTFLLLSVDSALGCVCVSIPNLPAKTIKAERLKDFRRASVVFTGEVVSLDTFRVKFKVDKIWKWQETEEITMLTGTTDFGNGTTMSSTCDYLFNKGQSYFVVAYGPPENLKTSVCARTALLKDAEKEIKGFDKIAPHKTVSKIPRARVGG